MTSLSLRIAIAFAFAQISFGIACTTPGNTIDQENGSACPMGSEGCPCSEGNSCDEKLVCSSKVCVEDVDSEHNDSDHHDSVGDSGEKDDSGPIDVGPVDLLLVMDNSLTMARHASRVGFDLSVLVDHLVEAGVHLRMGVTTTDMTHSACWPDHPENGGLRLSSCRSRLEDFLNSATESDAQASGCTHSCSLTDVTTTPTKTHLDPETRSRAWIELSETTSNLAQGQKLGDTLACIVPQGINGCGFEAPLEAMHAAIQLSEDPTSQNYGFLRPEAQLVVLIVTDEVDCSAANMDIFTGNTTFLHDPEAGLNSGICWRAGTRCSGTGSPYDECVAENFGPDGMPGVSDDQAVMRPLSRYLDVMQSAGGMLFALNGVPRGFGFGETDLEYFEPEDIEEKNFWGIAPGCSQLENPEEWALPPVRLRTLAAQLQNERNLFSICRSNHHETMEEIASRILRR